jgi:hypothetical protein
MFGDLVLPLAASWPRADSHDTVFPVDLGSAGCRTRLHDFCPAGVAFLAPTTLLIHRRQL